MNPQNECLEKKAQNQFGVVPGMSAETLPLLIAIPGPIATWVTFDGMNNARVSFRVKDGETGQNIYGVVQIPVSCSMIEKVGLRVLIKDLNTIVAEQLATISSKAPLAAAAESIGKVVSEVKKESGNVVSFPASPAPAEPVPKTEPPATAPAKGRRRAAPVADKEEAPPPPAKPAAQAQPTEDAQDEPDQDDSAPSEPDGGDEFGVDPGDVVCVFGKHKGKTLRQIASENIDSIRWYAATMPQAVPAKEKRPLTDEEKLMVEASRQLLNQREAASR